MRSVVDPVKQENFPLGRPGDVYETKQPDPPYMPGEHVTINGRRHRVTGVEAFASVHGRDPGQIIALITVPMKHIGDLP